MDVESSVRIKNSATPEQLEVFLNVLVQRARIINFNEVINCNLLKLHVILVGLGIIILL